MIIIIKKKKKEKKKENNKKKKRKKEKEIKTNSCVFLFKHVTSKYSHVIVRPIVIGFQTCTNIGKSTITKGTLTKDLKKT